MYFYFQTWTGVKEGYFKTGLSGTSQTSQSVELGTIRTMDHMAQTIQPRFADHTAQDLWTIRTRFADHTAKICGPYGPDLRTILPRFADHTAQICGPYGPDLWTILPRFVDHTAEICGPYCPDLRTIRLRFADHTAQICGQYCPDFSNHMAHVWINLPFVFHLFNIVLS